MAQVSRSALGTAITSNIDDNGAGGITPQEMRDILTNLRDSVPWYDELASASAPGIVELATSAETSAGSDATRAVTPAALAAQMFVASLTAGIPGSDRITNIVSLTQAEYNALTTPDPATLYVIVG